MLASHKGEIPFVVLLIPFLAGIALAITFNFAVYQTVFIVLFGAGLLAFILLNLWYDKAKLYRMQWVGGIVTHALLLLAGVLCTVNYNNHNHPRYFENHPASYLLVKVNNEPQFKEHFLRFTADVEQSNNQQKLNGTLLLVMPADSAHAANINYGDELLIPAKYNAVDPPFNPAEFNYKQYLAHQNIYAQAFLNPHDVLSVHKDAGNPVIAYSLRLRQQLVGQFKHYMRDTGAMAVASTLILGYKADLDNDILQAYSKTGTIHVLSVSGAHVAIIFWLINFLLGFLDKYKYGKLFKAVLSITLIWYYSLLTGLSPAVCRAAVMISMIIIGNTFMRRINSLNILAVSAFFILLCNPFLLTDVGFQLSYISVAGLIVLQPIVYAWLDVDNKWLDKLWLLCSVSIAAQVITFPLSAYYFHQFPVYFLVSNLFVAGLVAVIMGAGIACLLFAQLGWSAIAKVCGTVLQYVILLMNKGLQLIEHSPYASINKIWLSRAEYLLLFTIVTLLFGLFYYKRSILLKAALVCLLILSVSLSIKCITSIRTNNITFLNLKKHPAILFRQGNSVVLLTDLTDTDKAYRYSLQPCLDSNRINQVVLLPLKKDITTRYFIKKGNTIRFEDNDVLIIDKDLSFSSASAKFNTGYLFVTDNPKMDANHMNRNYNYRQLILSAANTDKFVNSFKDSAGKYDKKMYILKRNKSLIIQSN
jgi:competence protein ComEC